MELGVSWIWLGLESPRSQLRQAGRRRHADADARTARARHRAAGLHHHRPGAPHAGEHQRRDRARRRARDRLPPVHALHAGAGHAALLARCRTKAGCSTTSTWPTSTASDKFNFQHAAISRDDSKQFLDWAFRATSSATVRACSASAGPRFEGWKRYKNHPDQRIRSAVPPRGPRYRDHLHRDAVGHGAPLERYATPTSPPRCDRCAGTSPAIAECWRRCRPRCSAPCSCGQPAARPGAWPPGRATSPRPSSNAPTGPKRSLLPRSVASA